MGFDWKRAISIGVSVASIALPGGKLKDTVLANVVAIIESETTPNEDATKLLAASVDALAKEVKKLRSEVDALNKAKSA